MLYCPGFFFFFFLRTHKSKNNKINSARKTSPSNEHPDPAAEGLVLLLMLLSCTDLYRSLLANVHLIAHTMRSLLPAHIFAVSPGFTLDRCHLVVSHVGVSSWFLAVC